MSDNSPYRAGERFFSAPGICIRCGQKVPLGHTHVAWTSHNRGFWTCEPSVENASSVPSGLGGSNA